MQDAGLRERVGRRLGDVHRMGQGMVVHQMGIANKLSYMALDDIMFPGVVRSIWPAASGHISDVRSIESSKPHSVLSCSFPVQGQY